MSAPRLSPAPSPSGRPALSGRAVVTGAGPVGTTVARLLAASGTPVRVLTRSGSGPEGPGLERRAVDARDAGALAEALDGATAVFHCVHTAYELAAWERDLPAAEQAVLAAAGDRVVVFPESLYSYDRPDELMTEGSSRGATSGKRGVRARLLAARAAAPAPTVSVVASDFYGPEVRKAYAGERMVPLVLAGKRVRVLGAADQPHSFTYVPDLAAAMVAAAADPAVWGRVLHAPTAAPVTQRQLAEAFAAAAGTRARVSALPGWVLRALGLVSGDLRELQETQYQLQRPFVMGSQETEALLGLAPTPLAVGARATVDWWRAQA